MEDFRMKQITDDNIEVTYTIKKKQMFNVRDYCDDFIRTASREAYERAIKQIEKRVLDELYPEVIKMIDLDSLAKLVTVRVAYDMKQDCIKDC